MALNIRNLETLLWISRLGGFGQAAKRLNSTQPTISMRIRDLERDLGVKLFDRSRRAIRLTEKGRECVEYAERIVALASHLQQRVSDPKAVTGRVRVGVSEAVAMTWLPALVARLNEDYPGIVLELDVGLTLSMWKKLDSGELDIVILPGPIVQPNVVIGHLGNLDFMWMASPRLKIPDRTLTPKDLESWPVVTLTKDANLHFIVREWFETNQAKAHSIDVCNSLSAAAALTIGGVGISLLPPDLFRAELAAGRLRIIKTRPKIKTSPFYAAFPFGQPQPLAHIIATLARTVSTFAGKSGVAHTHTVTNV